MRKDNKSLKNNLSIVMTALQRQVSIAFALMTILPITALSYFILIYLLPNIVPRESIFLVFLICVVLALLGYSILRKVVRSIVRLKEYIEAIAQGDFSQKLDFYDSREMGTIGESIVLILDRLQENQQELERLNKELKGQLDESVSTAEREKKKANELQEAYRELEETQKMLVQTKKMVAARQLAKNVIHDAKVPLGVIVQGIDYLERTIPPQEKQQKEVLDMIRQAVKKSDKITRSMLDFLRPASLELKPCYINKCIKISLGLLEKQLNSKGMEVVVDFENDLPQVMIDESQMEHVFMNLILNSMQAITEEGQLRFKSYAEKVKELEGLIAVQLKNTLGAEDEVLVCRVEDTGTGIPEDKIKRIWDPFFTTGVSGESSGLGLTIAKSIVEDHKGFIGIESRENIGTTVTIILPVCRKVQSC